MFQGAPAANVLLASAGAMALGIICLGISLGIYVVNLREQATLESEIAATEQDMKAASARADRMISRIGRGDVTAGRGG